MYKERIHYLLERYYNDTLSYDETTELSLLIEKTDEEETVNILTEIMDDSTASENNDISIDELEIKVEQILSLDKSIRRKLPIGKSNTRWLKYSIAAAAAVIIIVGYFVLSQNLNNYIHKEKVADAAQIDIQPGKDGAVLVLADGTEISLDSAGSSKVVVNRDGSKIKVSNGQIVYLDNKNISENSFNSIRTPKGRQYHLTLTDGTNVWLNAASSIKYPVVFTKNTRNVTISGEAYFEVAKNPKKPFIVNIENSNTNIEVLGTHFNVNTYADNGSYKTTLLEGSIKLNTGNQHYLLKPNQQAVNQPNSDKIQLFDNIDPEDIVAWKNDLFYFNDATIDDVMQEFARWYNITVVYEGSKPLDTFTGKIDKNLTLGQALKILGATSVKYKLTPENELIIQYHKP